MPRRRWAWPSAGCAATAAGTYALVAVVFTWPLVRHLSTKLTGLPSSDLGVYVWNLWVFHRELLNGGSPLFTSSILSLDMPADLSLHNYTIASDVLALPLLPAFGVVASHNVLVLVNLVLSALAMFLLASHVVRRHVVAWLAGLLFGFSPMLLARSDIHPSLSAAAALPLFVLALLRLDATRSFGWAIAAGATIAWAGLSDPYYAVYCAMLGAWYLWTRATRMRLTGRWEWRASRAAVRAVDGLIVLLLVVVAGIAATGGGQFTVGPIAVRLGSLYTPNLLLTLAVIARVLMTLRPRISLRPLARWTGLVRLMACSGATAAVLLSPILYSLARRIVEGRFTTPRVYWRTSTPGADLLTIVMPNPNHPWWGGPWRDWLTLQPGGYAENVTSVTLVAIVVIVVAMRFAAFRVPRFWGGLAVLAASLTLGPFVRVAGAETYLPTPWAILRYVPVIGSARAPARFAVLLALGAAVVFALAIEAFARRRRALATPFVAAAGALLIVELCPAPRQLYDAVPPAIYATIASDPRDIRVLELPFGVRDGLSSFGNFSASSQFYQTWHGKRLIGGYLSRVSGRRVEMLRKRPVLALLMNLSEGRAVSDADVEQAAQRAPEFVRAARIGYVVVDRARASRELIEAATGLLQLEKVAQSGSRDLYRPLAMAPIAVVQPASAKGARAY